MIIPPDAECRFVLDLANLEMPTSMCQLDYSYLFNFVIRAMLEYYNRLSALSNGRPLPIAVRISQSLIIQNSCALIDCSI